MTDARLLAERLDACTFLDVSPALQRKVNILNCSIPLLFFLSAQGMSGINYYIQNDMRPKALALLKNNFQTIDCGKLHVFKIVAPH